MIDLCWAEERLKNTIDFSERLKRQIKRIEKYNISKGDVFYTISCYPDPGKIAEYKIIDCRLNESTLGRGMEISYKKENLTHTLGLDDVLLSKEEVHEKKKEMLLIEIEKENQKIKFIKEKIIENNHLLESFIFNRASLENDLLILENGETNG